MVFRNRYFLSYIFAILVSLFCNGAEASIKIFDSGQSWDSEPDKTLGQSLWNGYDYMGRMQVIQSNLNLCLTGSDKDKELENIIIQPKDSLPGTFFCLFVVRCWSLRKNKTRENSPSFSSLLFLFVCIFCCCLRYSRTVGQGRWL